MGKQKFIETDKTIIRVMKYEIFLEEDRAYKSQIYTILFDIMNETRKIGNCVIYYSSIANTYNFDVFDRYDVFPNISEDELYRNDETGKPYKRLTSYIMNIIKKEYSMQYSGNTDSIILLANKMFESNKKNIFLGQMSIPNITSNFIVLHNNAINPYIKEEKEYIDLALMSKTFSKEQGFDNCKIKFRIKIGDKTQKTIFERIISNQYKIAESKIVYNKRKKKFMIALAYKLNVVKNEYAENTMSIDIGIKYLVYANIFNKEKNILKTLKINSEEINNFRKQIDKIKKSKYEAIEYRGTGTRGKGLKKKYQSIKKDGNKIANFRNTLYHKYTAFIMKNAIEYGVNKIIMEDLTDIKNNILNKNKYLAKFLQKWSYYDLQQKIKNKAEKYGIEIIFVQPKNVNIRCSKCGYESKENKTKDMFKCVECGNKMDINCNVTINLIDLAV